MTTKDPREWLTELLPRAAHKHIDAILDWATPDVVSKVEVTGARVPIEHIEVYGLVIGVDANGNAAVIEFPYKAEVTA